MRAAQLEDAAAIAEIERLSAAHPWSHPQIRDTLQSKGGEAWIIGDPAIAHLLTQVAGPTVDILTIAVHPEHRRQGVARRLLDCAVQRWSDCGIDEVFLEVRTDNEGARCLYTALGFDTVGERRRYYSDGCDAIVMRRTL